MLRQNGILADMLQQPLKNEVVVKPWQQRDRASVAHLISKEKARRWFEEFLTYYFPHHYSAAFGEHHKYIIARVQDPGHSKREVFVCPRESGKSSLMDIGAPAWWLARMDKWYIILFGATGGVSHFGNLQTELDRDIGNQKLLNDYPHLAPLRDMHGHLVSWNDGCAKVSSGAVVEARSMMGHVRGLKQGKSRPDGMIFDDPQDEETVATDYQRSKFYNRFKSTLVNLIAPRGDIYVIGNFLHPDAMAPKLLREHAWHGRLYRAENVPIEEKDKIYPIGNTKTDGSPLWPEAWPMERLKQRREEIGNRAYALEFMNRPTADEEVVFDSTAFAKYDRSELTLDDSFDVIAFWDPSDPKDNRYQEADYACITVVASKLLEWPTPESPLDPRSRTRRFHWVWDVWMNQARIELQVEAALRLLQTYPIKRLYYEDNGGFGVVLPYLKLKAHEQGVALPLKRFEQRENKIQRIYNAEPIIKSRVFFANHLSTTYWSMWDDFPHGTHDDGPDCTVSAILAAERSGNMFVM